MTDPTTQPRSRLQRGRLAAVGAGLLVLGGVAGTVASHALQPAIEMAPLKPVAIRSLPGNTGIVTIRGRVAETYGNKFVIDDGSARTLVDTGRAGDDAKLVSDGAAVTVQGRFERGFVHASFLVDPAGKVTAIGPMGPPHGHGDHGPGGRGERGHDGPPPPPPADGAAPPAPPTAG